MKSKKKITKLEFNKETIARLGEGHMKGLYGGTYGGNPSMEIANQCTLQEKTKGPKRTCNALICTTLN